MRDSHRVLMTSQSKTLGSFRGIKAGNTVQFHVLGCFSDHLTKFEAGTELIVTVDKWIPPKTNPQLRYYHGILLPNFIAYVQEQYPEEYSASRETCKKMADHFFKKKYLTRNAGKLSEYMPNKRDLNKSEMRDFIEDVYLFLTVKMKLDIESSSEYWARLGLNR